MSKLTLLLNSLFGASLAVSACAADYGPSGMGMDKMKGDTRMGMMKGECLMDREGMGGDCMLMGRHKMTGTVSMINHAKGTLVLKSGVADMTLHFPPDSIKTLKNGSTVTVYLGFRMAEPVVTE
ncbi:hypothetical protein FGKAn22_14000 [Ferrigenium kumadai]|uniref:Uncharacterized protein n=1 Tax=Ferrigenium kumadai TaxID=1682490 RepID=A0AAN1W0U1_9PROT|nr:hypothetical protein [Ferrigenium kumadai]BBI99707.1 hypothetical protein FGKAn22_14000 [Ferrigenium kumadai]